MIYLDNAATTFPKPSCVVDAMAHFMTHVGANPGRSAHTLSVESANLMFKCRKALSSLIGQKDFLRTFFTQNATMAINTCLYGLLREGDIVLTTSLEHNALMRPLKMLEEKRGIKLRFIPCDTKCKMDISNIKELARGARLIACVHGNNVTGALMPLDFFASLAKEVGAYLLVDASQSAGLIDINMQQNDIDMLCASAHKGLYGPMGLGFFSLSSRMEQIESFMQGGTGSRSEEEIQPNLLPDKYESGTPNMPAIAGLYAALKWREGIGSKKIYVHEIALKKQLEEGLKRLNSISICKVDKEYATTGVLSCYFKHETISKIAQRLDKEYGILTRVGLHCSPATHKSIGTMRYGGTIRFAPSFFTTIHEIDSTIDAMKEIVK